MKPESLKLGTVILLIAFISAGCQKDDIFELNIGDENAVIEKERDGIEFKFCLLNEQGEPATVFNEDENFTFQFSVKNNTDTTIYFDNSLFNVNGFCEVHYNDKSVGMSFEKPVFMNLIGRAAFSIPGGATSGSIVKWIPDEEAWNSGFVYFNRSNVSYLSKGKYFTAFIHKFDFGTRKTEKLTFKINFEIK